MPQIYFEPKRQEKTPREEVGDITNLIIQLMLREQMRKQKLEDEIKLFEEKAKIQQKYGGFVNIVDPVTGEVKTVYTAGGGKGKTLLGKTPKAPPKMGKADIEAIEARMGPRIGAETETPYLRGVSGFLERFMPWGGVMRRRGMMEEFQRRMEPFYQRQEEQFQQPAISPVVKEGTITGRFTGGMPETPAVPPEIAEKYPDAYQGEDGQWYWDDPKTGKTYRLRMTK